MTNENQGQNEGEQAGIEESSTPPAPAQPTMNRAERRAQAKGKKGATPGGNPMLHHPGNPSGGGFQRGQGGVGKTRLPRTGHK